MKEINLQLILIFCFIHVFIFNSFVLAETQEYVEGEIIVKFKKNEIGLNDFENQFSLQTKETLNWLNVVVFKILDQKSIEEKIEEIKKNPENNAENIIEYVEPNYLRYPLEINTDDPHKNLLWALENFGQGVNGISGTEDADIDFSEAREMLENIENEVIVAIIDTGVAYNHPDLDEKMWRVNNWIDEEGNQKSGDEITGFDFKDKDNSPLDSVGHGTHLAGVIGAIKGNRKGILGVAPNVKMMALRVGDESGFSVVDIVRAIFFAKNNGAKIINASFGGKGESQLEKEAIYYFKEAGGLFITSAGNDGIDIDQSPIYPCAYELENIICVTATNQNDQLARFSNYGKNSVDIGAPGVNIYSVFPSFLEVFFENFENTDFFEKFNATGVVVTSTTRENENTLALKTDVKENEPCFNFQLKNPLIFDNLEEIEGVYFNFLTKFETNSSSTYLKLSFSQNEENFTEILKISRDDLDNEEWKKIKIKIPPDFWEDLFNFRFEGCVQNGDIIWIDDIKIFIVDDGSNENYEFLDGTSISASFVSGLASLIWGIKPELTFSEVKEIILNTGDSLTFLENKTATGKRINLFRALDKIEPPIIDNFIVFFDISNPSKISVLSFDAYDNSGNCWYLVSEDPNPPSFDDPRWLFDQFPTPIEYDLQREGIKTLYGWVKDGAGNFVSTSSSILIDWTPPPYPLTLLNLPPKNTKSTSAKIMIGGEDVAFYKYKLDNGDWSEELPVTIPIEFSELSLGYHTLYVLGRDAIGNWQTAPTSYTWRIYRERMIFPSIPIKNGDFNGDGKVDKYDLGLMMANWERKGANPYDLNGDAKVDKYDFALLMLYWTLE